MSRSLIRFALLCLDISEADIIASINVKYVASSLASGIAVRRSMRQTAGPRELNPRLNLNHNLFSIIREAITGNDRLI